MPASQHFSRLLAELLGRHWQGRQSDVDCQAGRKRDACDAQDGAFVFMLPLFVGFTWPLLAEASLTLLDGKDRMLKALLVLGV